MKPFVYLLCAAALVCTVLVFGSAAAGGGLGHVELVLTGLMVFAVLARWRSVARRREREKMEAMRDSALW